MNNQWKRITKKHKYRRSKLKSEKHGRKKPPKNKKNKEIIFNV